MGAATTYRSDKLQVPGASLYYEVRGSGPVLLMMPGGPADATTFRQIENDLASRYTVVTYDPRGLSHSKLEGALDDARMVQIFADDVHRLVAKLTDGKARVFASSGGAVIANEPPSPSLVPNSAKVRAAMEDVSDTHTKEGLWPAMNKFMVLVGIEGGPPPASEGEPAPEQLQAMAQMQQNMDFFFGRYIRNIARYQPDFAALKSCPCR